MARSRKPFPGMGRYVVAIENYPGKWGAYAGANTPEGARRRKREMSQWPADKITIVENIEPIVGATVESLGSPGSVGKVTKRQGDELVVEWPGLGPTRIGVTSVRVVPLQ